MGKALDLKALDAATDYAKVLKALFGDLPTKGSGTEIYMTPPMRPEEKVAEQRFKVWLKTGQWKDYKTDEHGNMLTLAKNYGPRDWRARWIRECPEAREVFGVRSARTTSSTGKKATTKTELTESFDPESIPATDAQPSLFQRAVQSAKQSATTARRVRPTVEESDTTFATKVARGQKMTNAAELAPFAEAWKVDPSVLTNSGAWAFTHTKGPLSKKPQLFFPMVSPVDGRTVGIKKRGIEPIYKAGDKLLKSKNEKGSKLVGLHPWHRHFGSKPLLLVEGEKDWAVAEQELGEEYDVVANLGGAKFFSPDWVEPFCDKWTEIYICYDADDAGAAGARKAATLLRGGARTVSIVRLPQVGADLFDMLRGEDEKSGLASVRDALVSAEPMGELAPSEVDDYIRVKCCDEDLQKDDYKLSQLLYQVMSDNGALFYQEDNKLAFCSWRKKVYAVKASNPMWNMLISEYTKLFAANPMGRKLHDNLEAMACARGKPVESGKWTHYDGEAIYLQLYNEEQQLLRISADEIEVVSNGYNNIVFMPSQHVPAIEYMPDVSFNMEEAEKLYEGIWRKINCSPKWQEMCSSLVKSFFFYDFMQTHPIIRFQGPAGSGKSTAQQFMSLLLYGHHDLIGDVTAAAMFRLARDMPVVMQDDLEDKDVKNMGWVSKFYLRAAMGGLRFKSASDSEDTVNQPINCWIVNSGIHSIADDTPALNERLIVVPVREREDATGRFMPMAEFLKVKSGRNLLWNYLYREIQRMLHAIQTGKMTRVLESMPEDQRPRLHEIYAIMSLARHSVEEADHMTLEWLASAMRGEQKAVVESSHVSELLYYLPSFIGNGVEGSGHLSARAFKNIAVSQDNGLWVANIDVHTMHAVLSRMARDTGLKYWLQNGRRLSNELRSLRKAGEQEGLALENDRKQYRIGGKIVRKWRIEIDLTATRALPEAPELDLEDNEEDIPF